MNTEKMIIVNFEQGSPEWHQYRASSFNASDAASAVYINKYKSRQELLHEMKTGEKKPVSDYTQMIFDEGHRVEALARTILEEEADVDLHCLVAYKLIDGMRISASFDGLCSEFVFEHKTLNKDLKESLLKGIIPEFYHWQLEQQLLVSDAPFVCFVCSDGTEENWFEAQYFSDPVKKRQLIERWKDFEHDLINYIPVDAAPVLVKAVSKTLPDVSYQLQGLELTSNLTAYKAAAINLVAESKLEMTTDQEFADREVLIKDFKKAEDQIVDLKKKVLSEIKSVDQFCQDLSEISELIRQARLNSEKLVKTEKQKRKDLIVSEAYAELKKRKDELDQGLSGFSLGSVHFGFDFDKACSGKKTLKSMNEAVADALREAKTGLNNTAQLMQENIKCLEENKGFKHCLQDFSTLQIIAGKAPDHFNLMVKQRIQNFLNDEEVRIQEEKELRQIEDQKAIAAEQKKKEELLQVASLAQVANHASAVIADTRTEGKEAIIELEKFSNSMQAFSSDKKEEKFSSLSDEKIIAEVAALFMISIEAAYKRLKEIK